MEEVMQHPFCLNCYWVNMKILFCLWHPQDHIYITLHILRFMVLLNWRNCFPNLVLWGDHIVHKLGYIWNHTPLGWLSKANNGHQSLDTYLRMLFIYSDLKTRCGEQQYKVGRWRLLIPVQEGEKPCLVKSFRKVLKISSFHAKGVKLHLHSAILSS